MFKDLTSPEMNNKLVYLVYHTVINCERVVYDDQATDEKIREITQFKDLMFY